MSMILNPYNLVEGNHAATAIIMDADGRILMFMDDRAPIWTLAGGGNLDDKDPTQESSYIDTVHRESWEEACAKIEIIEYVGETWGWMRVGNYNHERIYLSRLMPNTPAPQLAEDGAAIGWFSPNALPKNTAPRVCKRIESCFDPKRQGPFSTIYDDKIKDRRDFAIEVYSWKKEDITGLDLWLTSDRVQAKLVAGRCFDPFNNIDRFN